MAAPLERTLCVAPAPVNHLLRSNLSDSGHLSTEGISIRVKPGVIPNSVQSSAVDRRSQSMDRWQSDAKPTNFSISDMAVLLSRNVGDIDEA